MKIKRDYTSDTSAMWALHRLSHLIGRADRFVRLHVLFFTALWPLLGAVTVAPHLSIRRLTMLVAIAICFHVYSYVLNDVIDLPIDRTHPGRQSDPLVRGTVRPAHALLLALAQPPLAIALTVLAGHNNLGASVTLAAGFALMGVYNLWGKRCAFPPLTDAIQGLAWGSLAVYATQALGTAPNALTWIVASYATVYIVFINGIHGSLRDLSSDRACGARTTATFLGARTLPDGAGVYVPGAMVVYAALILAVLIALNAALIVRGAFDYGRLTWIGTTAIVAALNIVAAGLQPMVVRPRGRSSDVAWRLQMYLVMLSLPAALAARADGKILIVLALLIVLSLALIKATPTVVEWAWLTIRGAASREKTEPIRVHAAPAD